MFDHFIISAILDDFFDIVIYICIINEYTSSNPWPYNQNPFNIKKKCKNKYSDRYYVEFKQIKDLHFFIIIPPGKILWTLLENNFF